MNLRRFPWFRRLSGLWLALAAVLPSTPLSAQGTPVPAAPTVLTAIPPAGDGSKLYDNLDLSDNPTSTVLDLLEQLTGRSVIRPQGLPPATFTFKSHGPISKRDLVIALESLLTLNGIAVTPMGDKFIKVVAIGSVRTEAPELVIGSLRDRPPSGLVVSKLFRLEHLDTLAFQAQVQPFLSPTFGTVVPFQNSNTLLVTDTISNLQRLEYVLVEVDKPRNLVTKFYTLKFAQAQDVAEKVKSMIETTRTAFNRPTGSGTAPGGVPLAPGTPALPPGSAADMSAGLGAALLSATTSINFDDRTNQVILISDPSSVPFYDNLIEKLDVQAAPNTKIEVIQIAHAQATEIASLLGSFISGTSGGGSTNQIRVGTNNNTSAANRNAAANRNSRTSQQRNRDTFPGARVTQAGNNPNGGPFIINAGNNSNSERTSQFSEFISIASDERSNAIVVSGTQDDVNLIRDLIRQLDVILPQVQIDVLIAGVVLDKSVSRGIDAFEGIEIVANKITKIGSVSGPGVALADIVINRPGGGAPKNFDLTAVIKATNSRRNVRVLSIPSITTTHNQEASVIVGDSRPIITSTQSDVSGGSSVRSSYSFQDIGLELVVKPLIGNDGTIQMEIDQSADEPNGEVTIDSNTQPIIARRQAKSFVSVKDGEILVLGGLQRDSVQKGGTGFPILSEIPLIGNLFGTSTRSKTREEIIFFIQPHILPSTTHAHALARETLGKLQARDLIEPYLRPEAKADLAPGAAPAK